MGGVRNAAGAVLLLFLLAASRVADGAPSGLRLPASSGSSLVISVSMKPGATAFTVTPREPISRASDLVNPSIPALAAA